MLYCTSYYMNYDLKKYLLICFTNMYSEMYISKKQD